LLENYSKVRKELFKYSNKLTKKRLCFWLLNWGK
jgi:hypothetical protein